MLIFVIIATLFIGSLEVFTRCKSMIAAYEKTLNPVKA